MKKKDDAEYISVHMLVNEAKDRLNEIAYRRKELGKYGKAKYCCPYTYKGEGQNI